MFSRWTFVLAVLSLTAIGLLAYDLLLHEPTAVSLTGLALVSLTSIAYAVSLRHLQRSAFRSAMSTYADRQMYREAQASKGTFDAPSAAA